MRTKDEVTVGRKVWYWMGYNNQGSGEHLLELNVYQPFDATVVGVHSDGKINLVIYDHAGNIHRDQRVELHDPTTSGMSSNPVADQHFLAGHGYATWMPYQKKQHAIQAGA